jgi:uncharacterized protein YecE (DUF72 family)
MPWGSFRLAGLPANMSKMKVEVGISGWNYQGWKGTFYPAKLSPRLELEFASRELPSIEVNGTFYALQRPASFQRWHQVTPTGFVFSIKANRYVTHIKRLKEIEIPVANFFASGVLELQEKLGPILWQFPPSMRFEPDKFERFLSLLPHDFSQARRLSRKGQLSPEQTSLPKRGGKMPLRHAVEVRHESFLNPWFIELLRKYQVALVFADTAGKWPYMEDITADFVYIRLHGDSELYVSGYDDATLEFWGRRIRCWSTGGEPADRLTLTDDDMQIRAERDVYVYFDNDAKVRAPFDAKKLISILDGYQGGPQ